MDDWDSNPGNLVAGPLQVRAMHPSPVQNCLLFLEPLEVVAAPVIHSFVFLYIYTGIQRHLSTVPDSLDTPARYMCGGKAL